jgi:phosphatidylserine/phosphatidylglycerophosphate/cardiolipin synthase-like enzyme/uncharacterized membrane protein YdjX (TVP38/TMEM64 family)
MARRDLQDLCFRPGDTCWKTVQAERVSVLVETARYFEALRSACERAEANIIILGWDFDRRERLGRGDDAPTLEAFFCELLDRRADLQVWLLSWDYAFVYAGEREWFQEQRLRHFTHERLHVHFDGAHPVGGSQHQKIVVVDDRIAFCGGIDLSRWRWDTAEHAPEDPRRTDPDGDPYPPFHDAMLLVDGDAAAALAGLARQRWKDAEAETGPGPVEPADSDPWPAEVAPDWRDRQVAIARTYPAHAGRTAVREVEALYLDTVARARDYLYLENQYFTSRALTAALAERLEEPEGPDLVLVLPRETGGWLEQVTMDALRTRRVRALRKADRHDRLRVFYPHQPGLADGTCIGLHAKVTIADDVLVRVGSANTSNRSMGLDSECDLALMDEQGDGARGLLHRLLAEHLDCDEDAVAEARARRGRLIPALDELRRDTGRSLRSLPLDGGDAVTAIAEEEDLVDPDEPIDARYLVRRAVPSGNTNPGRRRLFLFLGFIAVLLALAASWRWTPLSDWLTTDRIVGWLRVFDDPWIRLLSVFALVAVTTLAMMPLSVLVVAAALILGPWQGFVASMAGALVSAAVAFVAGDLAGGRLLEHYGESRAHRLSKRLSNRGILAVAVLRLIPVAPYTVVNLVAGASHLQLGKFLVGTAIGLLPGVAALTWFSGSLYKAVTEPSIESFGLLGIVFCLIVVGVLAMRRLLRDS